MPRRHTADFYALVAAAVVDATTSDCVMRDSLRIEVQFPWILAALTGKIKGVLKSNAEGKL